MAWHRCFVCADNRKLCSSSDRKNGRQCSCAEPDLFGGICKDGRIYIFDGKGKAVAENEEKLPDTTDTEQWERLLFLTKYLTEILKEHGITAITLKGASTASFYPVPELRKSGDVDILITDAAKCEQACRLLAEEGFLSSGHQLTIHHGDFQSISPRTAIMHFI